MSKLGQKTKIEMEMALQRQANEFSEKLAEKEQNIQALMQVLEWAKVNERELSGQQSTEETCKNSIDINVPNRGRNQGSPQNKANAFAIRTTKCQEKKYFMT